MAVAKKEALKSSLRKGFDIVQGCSDHIKFAFMVKGKPVARTFVSHGGPKDLTDNQISAMAAECHLSRQEFIAFAKCIMTEKQYRQILVDKGIIKEEEAMAQ
jgi:hypothetical protein